MSLATDSAAPRFHSCPECLPVLDGGAECSWFRADHRDVPGISAYTALVLPSDRWRSFDWDDDAGEHVAGGSVECDDCRDDDLRDAQGDAYTQMALGYSARDAVDNIRAQYNLTDAECELVVDRLCGC